MWVDANLAIGARQALKSPYATKSARGQIRPSSSRAATVGSPTAADVHCSVPNWRRVPCVDGSELARKNFTSQAWSVQPCVRPVSAVHMTAGHNALRGQVPVKSPHSTMHRHMWVVLIAGSTGSALCAVRPPNLHITLDGRRDLVHAASATGSL